MVSFLGLITDGDIRRALERQIDIYGMTARDVMEPSPKTAIVGDRVEKLIKKNKYLDRHFTFPVVDDAGF